MYEEILKTTNDYLWDKKIKTTHLSEYLLPLRIKDKDSINKCLKILIKDREMEVLKNIVKIKTETGKALYYYQLKNDGELKQENLEYFVKENIKKLYYDLTENKYLTKKTWDENTRHFVWDTDNICQRICLFYKRIILDEDVLYPVVSNISYLFYSDTSFYIDKKKLQEYFKYNKQKRRKVYKDEDNKSLTMAEQYILDNLDIICEIISHQKMDLAGIAYYAWQEYYEYDLTYYKIKLMVENCKKYIEKELEEILKDIKTHQEKLKDIKFYNEKMDVVINNLDYNLMSNRLIVCWVNENLENFIYELKNQ